MPRAVRSHGDNVGREGNLRIRSERLGLPSDLGGNHSKTKEAIWQGLQVTPESKTLITLEGQSDAKCSLPQLNSYLSKVMLDQCLHHCTHRQKRSQDSAKETRLRSGMVASSRHIASSTWKGSSPGCLCLPMVFLRLSAKCNAGSCMWRGSSHDRKFAMASHCRVVLDVFTLISGGDGMCALLSRGSGPQDPEVILRPISVASDCARLGSTIHTPDACEYWLRFSDGHAHRPAPFIAELSGNPEKLDAKLMEPLQIGNGTW